MSDCYLQKHLYLCLFFSFSILLMPPIAKAQQSLQDSVVVKNNVDDFLNDHKNKLGHNLPLFNGREYISNGQKARGFPFMNQMISFRSVYYNTAFIIT